MEQAKELFLSGKKLIEISELLGIPEGTIRSWKNRYRWGGEENATLQKKKRNVAKRRGGQAGNKNAVGNKGGAAPEGNKNAVTTGEFETLLFDCLEPEERRLAEAMPEDKVQLTVQEIKLLTVRERRMLRRIEEIRKSVARFEGGTTSEEMAIVGRKVGIDRDHQTDLVELRGKLDQIQSIEEALTRVQARKQAAIDSLHRFGVDDKRLRLEMQRQTPEAEEETEDDGFLDAISGLAREDWSRIETGEEDKTAGI